MTSCHGPLSGVSWAWAPGQEPGWEKIQMPTVLDYENRQGSLICSTLPVFLSSDTVPLAPLLGSVAQVTKGEESHESQELKK